MRALYVYSSLLVAFILCIGCMVSCRESKSKRASRVFDDQTAKLLVIDHYAKSNQLKSIDSSNMQVRSVGENYRLIYVRSKIFTPDLWNGWIVSKDESMESLDLKSLCLVFYDEYKVSSDEEFEKVSELFIEAMTLPEKSLGYREYVIRTINDIPKYQSSPIDSDLAPSVGPPYMPSENELVLYTYSQLAGGLVNRYKFVFDKGGKMIEVIKSEIDRGVGDAISLQ